MPLRVPETVVTECRTRWSSLSLWTLMVRELLWASRRTLSLSTAETCQSDPTDTLVDSVGAPSGCALKA